MPEELVLDETKRTQLDKNIKEMLANGASQQDVETMASDFTQKFAVKKKGEPTTALPSKVGLSVSKEIPNKPPTPPVPLPNENDFTYGDVQPKPLELKPFIKDKPISNPLPTATPKQDLQNRTKLITPKLVGKEEEFVVPELNYQFKDHGFKFEEMGKGDAMKVVAPNGKETTINLDPLLSKWEVLESDKLKKFISDNSINYDKVDKVATQQSEYNKRIIDQKEIDATNKRFNDEIASFDYEVQQLNLLEKGTPEYTKKANELLAAQNKLQSNQKELEKSVGQYVEMKSSQGTYLGYLRNQLISGVESAASGTAGLFIDVASLSNPNIPDAAIKGIKKEVLPALRESLDFAKDETTKEYAASVGFIGGAIGGLVESLPAILAGEGLPLVMAAQISDGLDKEMASNPDFENVSELEKLGVKTPMIIGGAILEKYGLRNAIESKGLLNDIVLKAIGQSTKNTTVKTFSELIEQDVKNRLAKGTLKIGAGGLAEFETGASQELLDITTKQLYNAAKEKQMFQTPESLGDIGTQVIKSGVQEAIGGLILSMPSAISTAYKKNDFSKLDDAQIELLKTTGNDATIGGFIETNLKIKVASGEIDQETADKQLSDYRETVGVINQLPSELTAEQTKEAIPLRKKLNEKLAEKEKIKGAKKSTEILQTKIDKIEEDLINAQGYETVESETGGKEIKKIKEPKIKKDEKAETTPETKTIETIRETDVLEIDENLQDVKNIFDKFENDNYTENDLADVIENLNVPELQSAISKFREEQDYDRELSGRGDMDTANDNLISEIGKYIKERSKSTKQPQTTVEESAVVEIKSEAEQLGFKKVTSPNELLSYQQGKVIAGQDSRLNDLDLKRGDKVINSYDGKVYTVDPTGEKEKNGFEKFALTDSEGNIKIVSETPIFQKVKELQVQKPIPTEKTESASKDNLIRKVQSYNALSKYQKGTKNGLLIQREISESAGKNGLDINISNPKTGNIKLTKEGKQVKHSPMTEDVAEPTQEAVTFAKQMIKQGAVDQWLDIGLQPAEIKKGVEGIKTGKMTKPAKILINALHERQADNGFVYTEKFLDGSKHSEFVTFDQISEFYNPKDVESLSEAEQDAIYQEYLSLKDEELNHIYNLFNDETEIITQETGSSSNVSNQESGREPTAKELADKEIADAKAAFKKVMGNFQSGGFYAAPEFIRLVKAYINKGIVNVKEFISDFKREFGIDLDEAEVEKVFNKATSQSEPTEKGDEMTGVTHAQTDEVANDFGLPEYQKIAQTQAEWEIEADQIISKDKNAIQKIFSKLEKGGIPTGAEVVIMKRHIASLNARLRTDMSDELLAEFQKAKTLYDIAAGHDIAIALGARRGAVEIEDSLGDLLLAKKESAGVDELTENQKEEVKRMFDELEAAKKKSDELLSEANRENDELQSQIEFNKRIREQRRVGRKITKEKLDSEFDDLTKQFKQVASQLSSGLNPELVSLVGKMVTNRIGKGVVNLSDVIDAIHEKVSEHLTKQQINEIIAGKYNAPRKTRGELENLRAELKTEANLISQLEALERGEVPKTEERKVKRNQRLKELRDKIKDSDVKKLADIRKRNEQAINKINEKIANKDYGTTAKKRNPLDNPEFRKKYPKLYNEALDSLIEKENRKAALEVDRWNDVQSRRKLWQKAIDMGKSLVALSKALKSGFDDSVIMVQLGSALINPMNIKFAGKVIKAHALDAVSKKRFERELARVHNSEWWPLMNDSGLDILDPASLRREQHEEVFTDNPLQKKIKYKGKEYSINFLAPFERAFTSAGNHLREYMFLEKAKELTEAGKTFETHPEEFKNIAAVVNNMTARAKLPPIIAQAAPIVSPVIWSPKMMASALNLLGVADAASIFRITKGYYRNMKGGDGTLKGEWNSPRAYAIKQTVGAISMGYAILFGMALAGADVDDEPESVNFGSFQLNEGGDRYFVFGRFTPWVRLIAMSITGEKKTPKGTQVLGEKHGGATKGSEALKFLRGKVTPSFGTLIDAYTGKMYDGTPFSYAGTAKDLVTPMSIDAIQKGLEQNGIEGLMRGGLSFIGTKISNEKDFKPFDNKPVKRKAIRKIKKTMME